MMIYYLLVGNHVGPSRRMFSRMVFNNVLFIFWVVSKILTDIEVNLIILVRRTKRSIAFSQVAKTLLVQVS